MNREDGTGDGKMGVIKDLYGRVRKRGQENTPEGVDRFGRLTGSGRRGRW